MDQGHTLEGGGVGWGGSAKIGGGPKFYCDFWKNQA